jgi:N-acetylglucosaminyl-diphospho-decaprenol L-rhamnosyltransferase
VTAAPRVSAVIVSFNTRAHLLRCVASLEERVSLPLEIVVVDNGSGDGSAAALRAAHPAVRVLENGANLGFAAACNRGLREVRAPYCLLLNSDAEVRPGAVEALAEALDERPEVGIVGPRTMGPGGGPQVSFGPDLTPLSEWRQRRLVVALREGKAAAVREVEALSAREQEPVWVSAACLLARKAALDAVGGLDERFFLYEEDVDLCLRVRRAGWRILYTPRAVVVHHLGKSMESAPALSRLEYDRSHLRFYAKHRGPAARALLRLYLAGSAAAGWVAALGPGPERQARRRERRDALRVAVSRA